MTPQRIMKGNIDDVGHYYIIRHGEHKFLLIEVMEDDSAVVDDSGDGLVLTENTKILDVEELNEWTKPLIENGIMDGDNYDWFISDRNL